MEIYNSHDDQEWFGRIAKGDEEAFAEVFHVYTSRLFHVVVKILKSEEDAEEVIQNVFLKLWLQREKLPSIEKPGAWLNRVASNEALNFLRRKAVATRYLNSLDLHKETEDNEPANLIDAKELQRFIKEAVTQLPPGRQEVFRMSRYEGKSREEIAEALGLSKHTVKNQLASALKFVQGYIEKKHGLYLPIILYLPVIEKIFRS